MEWVVKLEAKTGWGDVETIEVGRLERRVVGLTAEEVGLTLAEGKALLGELSRVILQTQMEEFATCARVCGDCLKLRRRRDSRTRTIVQACLLRSSLLLPAAFGLKLQHPFHDRPPLLPRTRIFPTRRQSDQDFSAPGGCVTTMSCSLASSRKPPALSYAASAGRFAVRRSGDRRRCGGPAGLSRWLLARCNSRAHWQPWPRTRP